MEKQRFSEVQIEILNPMRVACFQAVSPTPEEDSSIFIDAWISQRSVIGPVRNFGFDIDVTPEQQKAGCRGYEVWRSVSPGVQPSDGVSIQEFEGGLYAVMTIYTPFDDPFTWIPAGWKTLHEWVIQSSQYRGAGHQWLEELIPHDGCGDLKLYHPIAAIG